MNIESLILLYAVTLCGAHESAPSLALNEIHVRDPFILPVPGEHRYYLFGTHAEKARDFLAYTSADLRAWEGPVTVFGPFPGFWADRDFWAPEVHRYKGRYFMFASFKAEGVCRGTQVLVADSPLGPYRPHSDGPVTPRDWECLDGTLFVDDARQPWIVFCHEWLQVHDGEICALRLSEGLDKGVGEPKLLFRASEAPWVKEIGAEPHKGLVTDGPFLHRTSSGSLLMLWSSFARSGLYAEGVARSVSGKIEGPWKQEAEPIVAGDGGHGMLFRTFEGKLMLVLHCPNSKGRERARLFRVEEDNGSLKRNRSQHIVGLI